MPPIHHVHTHTLAWLLAINRSRSERSKLGPAAFDLCERAGTIVLTTGSTSGPLSLNAFEV